MQEDAWHDVASKTDENVESCRKRWRNLKTSTARYLKQRRSAAEKDIREYYLYDDMRFMIPHLKLKDNSSYEIEEPPIKTPSLCSRIKRTIKSEKLASKSTVKHENDQSYDHYEIAVIDGNESYILSRPEDHEMAEEGLNESEAEHEEAQKEEDMHEDDGHAQAYDVIAEEPAPKKAKISTTYDKPTVSVKAAAVVETQEVAQFATQAAEATICPDEMFMRSLLPDIQSMTEKQKRKFKIGVLSLVDDILST